MLYKNNYFSLKLNFPAVKYTRETEKVRYFWIIF